jgi:hypothetical protein
MMKSVRKGYVLFVFLTLSFAILPSRNGFGQTANPVVTEFEARAKEYTKEREKIERSLPQLSKQATPEEVAVHKEALAKAVQQARAGVKQGSIFTPEAAAYLKTLIAKHLDGPERAELRKEVIEAENKAVTVRVNYPYPASQEILEMPATLLMVLPQLPKQLKYRFVGRHMLLVDRENQLIIDYITNAVP